MNQHHETTTPPLLSLSGPAQIAEALELFISPRDRACGAVLVLLCDDQRHVIQPILVEDLRSMPRAERPQMLRHLAEVMQGSAPDTCALVAIARPGPAAPTPTDEMWRREIVEAFEGRVNLLDVQLVTAFGSQTLSQSDLAA